MNFNNLKKNSKVIKKFEKSPKNYKSVYNTSKKKTLFSKSLKKITKASKIIKNFQKSRKKIQNHEILKSNRNFENLGNLEIIKEFKKF